MQYDQLIEVMLDASMYEIHNSKVNVVQNTLITFRLLQFVFTTNCPA